MPKRKINGDNKSKMGATKRRKLAAKQPESNVGMTSLNDDCIRHLLDWLSVKELCKLRVTCKRLYLLTNEHFQRTHGKLFEFYRNSLGFESLTESYELREYRSYAKSFGCLQQELTIPDQVKLQKVGFELMKYSQYCASSDWPNDLEPDLNDVHLKNQLQSVQRIKVHRLSDNLLQLFPNLEYIFYEPWNKVGKLPGKYPALKHFEMRGKITYKPQMKSFFKRNPNIKALTSNKPMDTTNWLLKSGIKFDDLVLDFKNYDKLVINDKTLQIIENVTALHRKQQIKRLHLKIDADTLLRYPEFVTLEFVEGIEIDGVYPTYGEKILNAVTSMQSLKCLKLNFIGERMLNKHHFELLSQKVDKLEDLDTCGFKTLDDIIPFVRHSANLRSITLSRHLNLQNVETTIQQLDKERRQLGNACKLTIYVTDENYWSLKSIWSTNSCGLVEIKRTNSYSLTSHPFRLFFSSMYTN